MEELRSTEVLEREILEDARKKAAKILKSAEDSIAQQKRDWERKLDDDLETLRRTYMDRMKKNMADIYARLPLDKRRRRLKTHEDFLSGAIDEFLSNVDRKRLLSLLERELLERLQAVAQDAAINSGAGNSVANNDSNAAVVRYSGLTLAEARAILKKSTAAFDWQFQDAPNELSPNAEPAQNARFPSIVIDTGAFRLTASVEAAAAALLKGNREELAVALLGKEALDD